MAKPINDLTGQKIGKLYIIKRYRYTRKNWKNPDTFYDYICECGNKGHTSHSNLVSSKKNKRYPKSCGCSNKEWINKWNLIRPNIERDDKQILINRIKNYYIRNANKAKHNWELSNQEFELLIFGNCYFCGASPEKEKIRKNITIKHSGIDRLDSSKDYFLDNCVSCCKWCNWAKNEFSVKEFLDHIMVIVDYDEKKTKSS